MGRKIYIIFLKIFIKKITLRRPNTNDIREEIKRRINMGNACYYSLEKILLSRLLSMKLKVKTYKTIILPVVLYGCETWFLTFIEEHGLRVFKNIVLRKMFGVKRE